ncbi:hypothetical protein WA1_00640 [Scytonema hofmannii PCC 7110]|uniref:Uncharacterized protein n=1 Tax=Scytonema hofmannii PCC 7110 TaxID=128403 RepID=A0A139XGA5_9CYAN|nr:hypothetical protein [Scytonema hofmannii]KYC43709.1 hypothetical protein WA1_00640 [Scytonema hofmannii PCC 7110]
MYFPEIIQKYYQSTDTNYKSNYKTVELQQTQYNNDVKVFDKYIEQGGTTLALIVFLSGLLVFLNSKTSKETSDVFLSSLEEYNYSSNYSYPGNLPCKKCYFFSANKYLPCAVNPTIVMTEEARNCSDYLFSCKR